MKKLPSESIDLIVTSPPYNLKNSTKHTVSSFISQSVLEFIEQLEKDGIV